MFNPFPALQEGDFYFMQIVSLQGLLRPLNCLLLKPFFR
jgi:hypothetical protein